MAQKPKRRSVPKVKQDDPEQSKLFLAKARAVGADGDRSDADALIGRLAKLPPQPKKK